ncbi:MAG: 50S ribosomal protein L29 [Clostridia bacterium]|nr:50S ribosomal protein L29 [Clostridia bacterium]MBQ8792917.1 50S ribosomal protein L29 [Clostridia bacterium]
MKINDIKYLSVAELNAKLKELNSELFNLRFSHATRSLANPMAIHNVKKDIARVKTVLREKELEGEGNGNN